MRRRKVLEPKVKGTVSRREVRKVAREVIAKRLREEGDGKEN